MSTDALLEGKAVELLGEKLGELAREETERAQLRRQEGGPRTFAEIETVAGAIGRKVALEVAAQMVKDAAREVESREVVSCLKCGRSCRKEEDPKKWEIQGESGALQIAEPCYCCPACRRSFFPSAC